MEKSALITKNKHSTRRRQKGIQKDVLWIKRKKRKKLSHWKNGKNFPTETEYPTIENAGSSSDNGRKAQPLSSLTQS